MNSERMKITLNNSIIEDMKEKKEVEKPVTLKSLDEKLNRLMVLVEEMKM